MVTGLDSAVSVAQRVEVYRNLSATEQSVEVAKTQGVKDRRIKYVWPDTIEADGYTVAGYFACAALAGEVSGVVPHQGLTKMALAGFTAVPRTTEFFSRANLNTMAGGGVWIITQDPTSGAIYTRHALTTSDVDTVDEKEEMVTRNLDSISYFFLDRLAPYIGVSNVTPTTLTQLRTDLISAINFLENSNFVDRLGPQLILGEIEQLRVHATLRDRIVSALNLTLPAPFNNLELHLVVVA